MHFADVLVLLIQAHVRCPVGRGEITTEASTMTGIVDHGETITTVTMATEIRAIQRDPGEITMDSKTIEITEIPARPGETTMGSRTIEIRT